MCVGTTPLRQEENTTEANRTGGNIMNLDEQRAWILSGNMYNDLTAELIAARE